MTDLEKYIYEEIVPRYSAFDPAHREEHASTVINQALKLMEEMPNWINNQENEIDDKWKVEVNKDILLTAAACHDLGLANGREHHHIDSGKIIREDKILRKWFNEEQIEVIAQAAEDHRASGKTEPKSIYGLLTAEADRVIDGETIIRRTIQFGFDNYPGLSEAEHIERAVNHLREKYGRGGYLRLWIPWSDNSTRLSALQDLIADDEAIRKATCRIYNSLKGNQ